MDFLHGKFTYSIGYVNSDESDYKAKTMFASVSHDMFGDLDHHLARVQERPERGVPQREDRRREAERPGVQWRPRKADMESKGYSVGVSQIVTKNLVLTGQYEVITDEGWLNSPYRSVRFFIGTDSQGSQPEMYPETHSSNSASMRGKYFLPYRAAIDGMYRFYTDTWGVVGHTAELGYVHPLDNVSLGGNWTFEGRLRYYTQNAADFYADIFPRADFSNFMARDKELATYNAITAGIGATYEFKIERFPWLSKGQINLRYDYMTVAYDDFRDATFSLGKFGRRARRAVWRRVPNRCTSCAPTSSSSTSARSSDVTSSGTKVLTYSGPHGACSSSPNETPPCLRQWPALPLEQPLSCP